MKRQVKRLQMLVLFGARYWFYSVNSQEAWGATPSETSDGKIVIGVDQDWWLVLDAIVHELFETCLTLRDKSFVPFCEIPAGATNRRWFAFDHSEFTLICSHVGNAMCALLPKYQAAWNKLNRKRR